MRGKRSFDISTKLNVTRSKPFHPDRHVSRNEKGLSQSFFPLRLNPSSKYDSSVARRRSLCSYGSYTCIRALQERERTSPRRSLTANGERSVHSLSDQRLKATLNEMNAFTCLLRGCLGASIRPFISSAPLPFSGWLPFLRGHRDVSITRSVSSGCLPSPAWTL